MICDKCHRDFEERFLDCSHDIPKYMGGSDRDGRHWLCKICHHKYEIKILIKCLIDILNEKFDENIPTREYMYLIKRLPEELQYRCRLIAKEIKEEFFKNE